MSRFAKFWGLVNTRKKPENLFFDDEKMKWTCLRRASRLKDDAVFQKLYLSPDLTPQERKENRVLLMELKWRREEGEKDIMIRRGRIVKKINTDN